MGKIGKKSWRFLGSTLCALIILTIAVPNKCNIVLADGIKKDLKKVTVKNLEKVSRDKLYFSHDNPYKVARVIVELEEPAAIEKSKAQGEKIPSKEDVTKVKENQKGIKKEAENITGEQVNQSFGTLINGFSIDTNIKYIDELKKIKGVKSVKVVKKYYPTVTPSNALKQAKYVWNDLKLKGEGMVISIIDSGIDPNHKDMRISNLSKVKLTKKNIKEGPGRYYTDKVPYGYNFADDNDNIIDTNPNLNMHGMHVAGIAAANGIDEEVEENKAIKGISPEAQLLAMKVFSNKSYINGASEDDIVAAIEESVNQGADIINLSLGSSAGFQQADDPEQIAVKKAVDAGVVVVVAAGNSEYSTAPYKFPSIGDTGLVGTPGTAKDAITVASYQNDKKDIENTEGGSFVASSSWGPTPSLDFKPQISAPGGNIYSTLNNNKYGIKTGTSMATPYISGGEALIVEGLKTENPNLKGRDLVELAKNTVISTSKIIMDKHNKVPYSPRRQGAGLIQIEEAIKNKVIVTDKNNNPTVALKQIGNEKKFTLKLKNYDNSQVEYSIENIGGVLTETSKKLDTMSYDVRIEGAKVTFDKNKIVVPAKGQVSVRVKLTIPKTISQDRFVEGFIKFTSKDKPSLSVPFIGYYGDWGKEQIIESMSWDKKNQKFIVPSGILTNLDGNIGYKLGLSEVDSDGKAQVNPDNIAISPNGDGNGDIIAPYLYYLRNARITEIELLDENKQSLGMIGQEKYIKKEEYSEPSGNGRIPNLFKNLEWDGKIYNSATGKKEPVKEGQYYLNIKSKVDYDNAKYQNLIIPVKVDITAPTIDLISEEKVLTKDNLNDVDYKLQWRAHDNVSVIHGIANININGKDVQANIEESDGIYSCDVKLKANSTNNIKLSMNDTAYNLAEISKNIKTEFSKPVSTLENDLKKSESESHKIVVDGVVDEGLYDKEVLPKLASNKGSEVTYLLDGKDYDGKTPISSEGKHNLKINIVDKVGNYSEKNINFTIIEKNTEKLNGTDENNTKHNKVGERAVSKQEVVSKSTKEIKANSNFKKSEEEKPKTQENEEKNLNEKQNSKEHKLNLKIKYKVIWFSILGITVIIIALITIKLLRRKKKAN